MFLQKVGHIDYTKYYRTPLGVLNAQCGTLEISFSQ